MAFKNWFSLAIFFSIQLDPIPGFLQFGGLESFKYPDGESNQSVYNLIRLINTERAGPISEIVPAC
jgi:hypothetical protein